MPESLNGHHEQRESNEHLEARLAEIHKMLMDCYDEDERLSDEIMEQFNQWEENQEPGKFDQSVLNQRMEEVRKTRETIKALYAEEEEIKDKLG